MPAERKSPLQQRIEGLVSDGLGFDYQFYPVSKKREGGEWSFLPDRPASVQVHLGNMDRRVKGDWSFGNLMSVVNEWYLFGALGSIDIRGRGKLEVKQNVWTVQGVEDFNKVVEQIEDLLQRPPSYNRIRRPLRLGRQAHPYGRGYHGSHHY